VAFFHGASFLRHTSPASGVFWCYAETYK